MQINVRTLHAAIGSGVMAFYVDRPLRRSFIFIAAGTAEESRGKRKTVQGEEPTLSGGSSFSRWPRAHHRSETAPQPLLPA